jgi:hypothetical protein
MTAGLSSANVVSPWLNTLRSAGASFGPVAGTFVRLHVGDPGGAGTANYAAECAGSTGGVSATLTASVTGSALSLSGTPAFTMTATETVSHISVWSAATGTAQFQFSVPLTVSRAVNSGDTLNLSTLSLGLAPQAA